MTFSIRPFRANDYAAIAEINNTFWTEKKLSAEQWQSDDANRPTHCAHARWVAESDGRVVGLSEYDQLAGRYHPDKYWLRVEVLPAFQRRGIGAALYDTVMNALTPRHPWLARFSLREDMHTSLRFLTQRGFAEEWRSYESHLDVTQFNVATLADAEEKLRAPNIVIKTYAELADDARRDEKLHELMEDTRADTAFIEPLTRTEYAQWREMFLTNHRANLEAFWVATRGDEYLGLAMLAAAKPGEQIDTRWVGVQREVQRNGIARAFKKKMIEYAQAHTHPKILTVTNSRNAPVIAMNRALGYVDQPAWVYYTKELRANE